MSRCEIETGLVRILTTNSPVLPPITHAPVASA
jgi:hypothetical protein